MNVAAAKLARAACDKFSTPDKPRFVAGALGYAAHRQHQPDVNDPAARNVTFDELRAAYHRAGRGAARKRGRPVLVETIFDTLNARAAIFALDELMDETGERLPLIVSAR